MSFAQDELSLDGFIGGKLKILQPKQGYRAATDPVFLSAATPVKSGQSVLELGCGVGVALACLSYRVADLDIYGLEIQNQYAELARRNFAENGTQGKIICGDLLNMPAALKGLNFDHVIANPPFFDEYAHTKPADASKSTAHVGADDTIETWIRVALKRLKPGGILTMLHRTPALQRILAALQGNAGDIRILPIASRRGKAAGRIIVRARKTAKGALHLLSPIVVHDGDRHQESKDDYSEIASGILRHGNPIIYD